MTFAVHNCVTTNRICRCQNKMFHSKESNRKCKVYSALAKPALSPR